MKQYYAAIVLSPLQVLTNLENSITAKEAGDVALFESPSNGFSYVRSMAKNQSIQAHPTALGQDLNQFFQLPGVGVMYRVALPQDAVMQEPSYDDKCRGIVGRCSITDAVKLEQQAIFVDDDFNHKPIEVAPMAQITSELSARAQNYEIIEAALANTPADVRKQFSPNLMPYEAMRMAAGPDSPARNGFTSQYPQDQKFWDMYKMLWENNAGIQYVVDALPIMYNKYRDGYARGIVRDESPALAAAKAVVTVLNWTQELAKQYNDTRLEDVLQDAGEQAVLDARQIEQEEQSHDEP